MMSSPANPWSKGSSILGVTGAVEQRFCSRVASPSSVLRSPSALLGPLVLHRAQPRDPFPSRPGRPALTVKNP